MMVFFRMYFPFIFHREQQGVNLPEPGRYATGIFFLDKTHHEESEGLFAVLARECDLKVSQIYINSDLNTIKIM